MNLPTIDEAMKYAEGVDHADNTTNLAELSLIRLAMEVDRLRDQIRAAQEQKPHAWDCGGDITRNKGYAEWFTQAGHGDAKPLYTIPAPAPAVPAPETNRDRAARIVAAWPKWKRSFRLTKNSPLCEAAEQPAEPDRFSTKDSGV